MAFRKTLILILPLMLFSCAQVGTISGGDKDEYAPKPISDQTFPPNESINFQGNAVEITFDEFIQLNNPSQTMVLVPNHAKLKASVHKKTLRIDWDEKLQENTTYVIYLNGTVKDVTENNDSLMFYAFTTGSAIDSLKYKVTVIDAWTNQFKPNVIVGLYLPSDTIKPYYFSKTNRFGEAEFAYLKHGEYKLKAFSDENQDLEIQASEDLAFRKALIQLDSSTIDSIPLRISPTKGKKKISTFKYSGPNSLIVAANYQIDKAKFTLNKSQIDTSEIAFITKDSLRIFTDVTSLSEIELIIDSENHTDTVSMRLTEKEKAVSLRMTPVFKNNVLGSHETVSFTINDKIASIDTSKIQLINPKDSTVVQFQANYKLNKLTLNFDRNLYKELSLRLSTGAVSTIRQQSDSMKINIQLKTEKDFGVINIDASSFEDQIIVEILQNNASIDQVVLNENKHYVFSNLIPGDYQFRIIQDLNHNEEWDPSDIEKNLQAERVFWFSTPTKVRANWEMDVVLSPTE